MTKKPYREYCTITFEQAFARGFDGIYLHQSHEHDLARTLLRHHGGDQVDFCLPLHNGPASRYRPATNILIWVVTGKESGYVRVGRRDGI